MNDKLNPQAAEQQFFDSLIGSDVGALERILSDDFLLIDVMDAIGGVFRKRQDSRDSEAVGLCAR